MTQIADHRATSTARRLGEKNVRQVEHFDDVTRLFGAADVSMKASKHEGVPYAALESLACGTSVVAANIPGRPLADGVAPACRVVPGKPETVAGAVAELLGQSAATRVSAVERSREWMGANLTATDVAAQMLQLFASGLARRS